MAPEDCKKTENERSNDQRNPQDVSNALIKNSSTIREKDNVIRNAHIVQGSEAYDTTIHMDDNNTTIYIDRDNYIGN